MATDNDLSQLVINKLTKQQYDSIANPSADEFFVITDGQINADDIDDTNTTNQFTNATEKSTWNAKYDKPSGGIPDTDLSSAVQTSLGKADTALQTHQDISGKEDNSNKVTTIDTANPSNTEYPSESAVVTYVSGIVGNINTILDSINGEVI